MGIPEGAAMKPLTVLFIHHWRLLNFGVQKMVASTTLFSLHLEVSPKPFIP
jgi:hypothetical protein